MEYMLFLLIILLANIVQGITGFAGTILAMPFSLMLVGYATAKPILNVLGLMSGLYVFYFDRKHVDYKELKRVVVIMAIGIAAGIFLKSLFADNERLLYQLLGVFIVFLGIKGMFSWKLTLKWRFADQVLLIISGIVHGMFVAGGPLLIGYLSAKIRDKQAFRATISTIWIILNTIVLLDDCRSGYWDVRLLGMALVTVPFLFLGMYIGTKLYARMSQALFMKLTYVLLCISGISLLVR